MAKSVDGLEVQGWLYRAAQPRGTIIHVHGGPTWLAEDRVNAEIQFYVAQGFNVLAPNYRGSTGFSLAFQESIKEDGWGGREQDDIRTGIEASDRRRGRRARPGRCHRHILWRLLVLVRDHRLAARAGGRRRADLRHDRPGGGLRDHPPGSAAL